MPLVNKKIISGPSWVDGLVEKLEGRAAAAQWLPLPKEQGLHVTPKGSVVLLYSNLNEREEGSVAGQGPFLFLDQESFWEAANHHVWYSPEYKKVVKELDSALHQVQILQKKIAAIEAILRGDNDDDY